ncbi:hypothetical protein KDX40_04715 [Burkholderia ambifaria]|uniref:Lar family restriction alleviation protein n=1 Tax=Burkholderia ambifaria TaxID=152480 RepID=UPI001B943491|nr:Lar family restriction alleviation protein [Burkholderia ambifaria]MBR8343040.1 hypothetical protein [Burkholderia ambifaria]
MTTHKSRADAPKYLLPCAFCGCTKCPVRQGNGIGDYWLECTDCGARTRPREDGAGSEKDWNRRPVEQREAAPADAPVNPYAHQGSLGEAWRKGFEGGRPLAAPGSSYMKAYDEGKAARVIAAQPEPAVAGGREKR